MHNLRFFARLLTIGLPLSLGMVVVPAAFAAVPTITSLSPSSAVAGGAAFTLTVNGTNFVSGATAKWGTAALTTKFVSANKLTAAVPASLIAKVGTASVTVTTIGGTSKPATFTINPPKPVIASLSPSTAVAGGAAFTLTINGKNFVKGAAAKWGSTALATTLVSATKLTAPVAATLIAKVGTASVTVTTAGGTSAAATFTVNPPKPVIASLSPSTAVAGGAAFTLTINGKNFIKGAAAKWGTTALTTTLVSAAKLTAQVAASLIAKAGTASVTVTTAGGTSAAATFTINPPKPVITSLSPSSAVAGGAAFTLTINGKNFIKGAAAKWGTTALTTTYKSAILLTAAVPASLIVSPGTASVTVTTAGGTSAPATFTINSGVLAKCANDGSGNAKLKGAYSFQFSQVDPNKNGEADFNLGAFTADGNGNIGGGLQDSNGPYYTAEQQSTFSGSYSVGPDDRGLLTVSYAGGPTAYFCFALDSFSSGVAGGGRLVSDLIDEQIDSGEFFAQGGSNFSVSSAKGSWAFGLQGIKLDRTTGFATRGAAAGYLTLDGTGKVTVGEQDTSQDKYDVAVLANSYAAEVGLSGTYTLAASGRGTLALNLAGGGTSNYVFYVAGPNQMLLLSTNAGGKGGSAVEAGRAFLRTTSTFNSATLSGTSVAIAQAVSDTGSQYYDQRLVEAGILSWTGAGKYTGSFDQNDAGNVTLEQASSGTYSVDANGRATLNGASPATFAYLVGPNQGFAVEGNPGVDFMYFEKQTAPAGGFTAGSFNGGYSDGSIWYGFEEQKALSGEIAATGTGKLTGTIDVAPLVTGVVDAAPRRDGAADPDGTGVLAMAVSISETYSASATGRFLVSNDSLPWQAVYFVSPNRAYAVDISGAVWKPLEEFNHQ